MTLFCTNHTTKTPRKLGTEGLVLAPCAARQFVVLLPSTNNIHIPGHTVVDKVALVGRLHAHKRQGPLCACLSLASGSRRSRPKHGHSVKATLDTRPHMRQRQTQKRHVKMWTQKRFDRNIFIERSQRCGHRSTVRHKMSAPAPATPLKMGAAKQLPFCVVFFPAFGSVALLASVSHATAPPLSISGWSPGCGVAQPL